MNGFDCYRIYVALKTHFNSDTYDYFTFHGKTNTSLNSFQNRQDQSFFHVLGKRYNQKELEFFFASNLMENNGLWIGQALEEECKEIYTEYTKRRESLSYIYQQDLFKLNEYLEHQKFSVATKLFVVSKHSLPEIITLTNQKEINSETCIILAKMFGLFAYWDKRINNLLYPSFRRKCLKFSPFISNYDKTQFLKVFRECMQTKYG